MLKLEIIVTHIFAFPKVDAGTLDRIEQLLKDLTMTVTERLKEVKSKLDEASTEILSKLDALKGENLSPEGEAALEAIEAKANALADIVPNEPPATGEPTAGE